MNIVRYFLFALLMGSLLIACGQQSQETACKLFKEADGTATLLCGKDKFVLKNGKDGKDGVSGKSGKDGTPGKSGTEGSKGEKGQAGPPGKDGEDGADSKCTVSVSKNKLTAVVKCGKTQYSVRLGNDIAAGTGCTTRKVDCGMLEVRCGSAVYRVGGHGCKEMRVYHRENKSPYKVLKTLKNGNEAGPVETLGVDNYYSMTLYDKYTSTLQAAQVQTKIFSNTACSLNSHCTASYCTNLRSAGRFDITCKTNAECVKKKAGTVCYRNRCHAKVSNVRCSSSTDCTRIGGHLCYGSTKRCYQRKQDPLKCSKSSDCTAKKIGNWCHSGACYSTRSNKCAKNSDCSSVKGICSTKRKTCIVKAFATTSCANTSECVKKKAGNLCYQKRCYKTMNQAKCTSNGQCYRYGGQYCSGAAGKTKFCHYKNNTNGYLNCYAARRNLIPRCEYSPFTGSRSSIYRCIWSDWSTRFSRALSRMNPLKKCKTVQDCPKMPGRKTTCYRKSSSLKEGECRWYNPAYHYSAIPYRTTCNWMKYSQSITWRTDKRRYIQHFNNLPKTGDRYEFNGYNVFYDGSKRYFRYKWYKTTDVTKCTCPTGKKYDHASGICK